MNLCGSDAGLETSHDLQPPHRWRRQSRHGGHARRRRLDRRELTVERERHGDVRAVTRHLLHADEVRRDDTDDRDRHVVEAHGLANDLWIAAEAGVPVPRADHGDRRGVGLIIVWNDRASGDAVSPSIR